MGEVFISEQNRQEDPQSAYFLMLGDFMCLIVLSAVVFAVLAVLSPDGAISVLLYTQVSYAVFIHCDAYSLTLSSLSW
jgi:hypothetical protein